MLFLPRVKRCGASPQSNSFLIHIGPGRGTGQLARRDRGSARMVQYRWPLAAEDAVALAAALQKRALVELRVVFRR